MQIIIDSRNLYIQKCNTKNHSKLTGISNGQVVYWFFNWNTRNRIIDKPDISCKYQLKNSTKIKDFSNSGSESLMDVLENIRWLEEARTVLCCHGKYSKKLCHALLVDDTNEEWVD